MNVSKVFETVKQNRVTVGFAATAALVLAVGSVGLHARSQGAVNAVEDRLRRAGLGQTGSQPPVQAGSAFINSVTGEPGRFELLGRDTRAPDTCFTVAITGGGYAIADKTVVGAQGRLYRQASIATACVD